ncbi:MAG TPA: hypothetical protein VGH49_04200 [Xanthobacteraceae bacterium]|jgi:hypothetical protein
MNLNFKCPSTKEPIITATPTSFTIVQENWSRVISQKCPHCGEQHSFRFREAYLDAVLHDSEFRMTP